MSVSQGSTRADFMSPDGVRSDNLFPMTFPLPTHLAAEASRRMEQAREQDPSRWDSLLSNAAVAESWLLVWGCSEFVATHCTRHPELLEELVQNELSNTTSAEALAQELALIPEGIDDAQLMQALRRFRVRHTVRIAWRDIAGWADLDGHCAIFRIWRTRVSSLPIGVATQGSARATGPQSAPRAARLSP
jgi:glutamine synthetase adenylyltransferase